MGVVAITLRVIMALLHIPIMMAIMVMALRFILDPAITLGTIVGIGMAVIIVGAVTTAVDTVAPIHTTKV